MEIGRKWRFSCLFLGLLFLATTLQGVQGEVESEGPSESECRPYIEKALKELETADTDIEHVEPRTPTDGESQEDIPISEGTIDDSEHEASAGEHDNEVIEPSEVEQGEEQILDESEEKFDKISESDEKASADEEDLNNNEVKEAASSEQGDEPYTGSQEGDQSEQDSQTLTDAKSEETSQGDENQDESTEEFDANIELSIEQQNNEDETNSLEQSDTPTSKEANEIQESIEVQSIPLEDEQSELEKSLELTDENDIHSAEKAGTENEEEYSQEASMELEIATAVSTEELSENLETVTERVGEIPEKSEEARLDIYAESVDNLEEESDKSIEEPEKSVENDDKSLEEPVKSEEINEESLEQSKEEAEKTEEGELSEEAKELLEVTENSIEDAESVEIVKEAESIDEEDTYSKEGTNIIEESVEVVTHDKSIEKLGDNDLSAETIDDTVKGESDNEILAVEADVEKEQITDSKESVPEEELILEIEVPENLRPRDHIDQLLKLDDSETETVMNRISEVTLRDLKKLYENAIKPLETLYKYRDLSNRHFGDSEIFSKPLVLFMGPWSGGKSSIINYLLDNEYNTMSLKTGAEPSPAYFNLLMYGEEPEILDGTQLAADFTFAGLQKFGQGLEERLHGLKLPSKLLEKINIVEIPGILEVRKQVSRIFPFNDACQWFIDRADIIFLVYDPSKLDVGPETEAILDQLKGREHQTRIILNKADQVKPEELMRVQSALIWNISPLMSSAQPPVMYTTSLWSRPYETWAPVRLLQAQERAFLRDLRSAVDKRIENKISSARRFAVRVRNHAKMVDCYLTTYYNHKSVFGNRKQVSDQIIEHPQDYHIYEGLSTLTNISRYDLPDPDVYRDFFRLNPLYDFQQLSATCTYFRGCPINRLDVAIAYDLPEMVGKHKKMVESALAELKTES